MSIQVAQQRAALNEFLCGVELRALRQTEIAVGNRDEALDIVQEAMMRLAKKYADKQSQWPQLFQRILQNAIRDYFRRKKVRSIFVWWQQSKAPHLESGEEEAVEPGCTEAYLEPQQQVSQYRETQKILGAVQALPLRQQQAFMLRVWMEFSVEECAQAMSCSVGSVKTHYSRAVKSLQAQIEIASLNLACDGGL